MEDFAEHKAAKINLSQIKPSYLQNKKVKRNYFFNFYIIP